MCGINGVYGKNISKQVDSMNVLLSSGTIEHITHVYTYDDTFTLSAVARQGIHNTEASAQMAEKENYCVVLHGHIYNKTSVRRLGANILIDFYHRYGLQMYNYLNGEYSFALLDRQTHTVLLGGDHMGIKPLYYYYDKNHLIFSSRIQSLFASGMVKKKFNSNSLYHAFTLGSCIGEDTFYKKIHRVEPGTYVTYQDGKIDKYVFKLWVNPSKMKSNSTEKVKKIFIESISSLCSSQNSLGYFLSGGIDSSLIGYFAKKLFPKSKSISATNYMDEPENTKEVENQTWAQKIIGSENITVNIQKNNLENLTQEVIEKMDDFAFHPSLFTSYLLLQVASQNGIRTILSGDGADELFLGYYFHPFLYKFTRSKNKALFIKRYGSIFNTGLFASIKRNILHNDHIFFSNHFYFNDNEKKKLFLTEFSRKFPSTETVMTVRLNNYSKYDTLTQTILGELLYKLRQSLTPIYAFASKYHAEMSYPFLGKALVDFALSISPQKKIFRNIPKYLLRKMAQSIFGARFASQRKIGLTFPTYRLLTKRSIVKHVLESAIFDEGIFSKEYVEALLKTYLSPSKRTQKNEYLSTFLIFFILWYNYHFQTGKIIKPKITQ